MLPHALLLAVPVLGQTASDTPAPAPSIISAASTPSTAPAALPPVMAPGSACPEGDNGQWNCLSNCWQRCAAGFWSDTMALAPGTRCIPLGLSFDLQIVNAGSTSSQVFTASTNSTLVSTEATCVCSTTSCTVVAPSSSSSSAPSSAPSSASSTTTNDAGFKNGHSSEGSSFAVDAAVVMGVFFAGGCLLL